MAETAASVARGHDPPGLDYQALQLWETHLGSLQIPSWGAQSLPGEPTLSLHSAGGLALSIGELAGLGAHLALGRIEYESADFAGQPLKHPAAVIQGFRRCARLLFVQSFHFRQQALHLLMVSFSATRCSEQCAALACNAPKKPADSIYDVPDLWRRYPKPATACKSAEGELSLAK